MTNVFRAWAYAGVVAVFWAIAQAGAAPVPPSVPKASLPVIMAPEPNPPVYDALPRRGQRNQSGDAEKPTRGGSRDTVLYSIGDPTDQEQLLVEYVNRARADAATEAVRLATITQANILSAYSYYGVDLNVMQSQFNDLEQSLPPVSIHPALTAAARLHSQDMLAGAFQGHVSSATAVPPNQSGDRITDRANHQNYDAQVLAENVYSFTFDPLHTHVAFEVDWGVGPGGMQTPPGHRLNIHKENVREIGVGVVYGQNTVGNTTVGPMLVTQDFGTRFDSPFFITGVAYFDLNLNNFYDIGEGIGGIRVDVDGSDHYAITSNSGGYSVPVPGNATYAVHFTGLGFSHTVSNVRVQNGQNTKVNFVPVYQPPTLSGSTTPLAGFQTQVGIGSTPGAGGYTVRTSRLMENEWSEGAEDGGAHVTIQATAGYEVISDRAKATGTYSYRLVHAGPEPQIVTVNRTLLATSLSRLRFWKRLGYATSEEIARAQVSNDGGATWTTLWSDAGDGTAGDQFFSDVTIDLSSYDGQAIMVRIVYDYAGGSYYPQTDHAGVGFYFDVLRVTEARELTDTVEASYGPDIEAVAFTPATTGTYLIQARAFNGTHQYPVGPHFEVEAVTGSPGTVTCSILGPTTARWKVVLATGGYDSDWQLSGAQVSGLLPGTYRVQFFDVDGWSEPDVQTLEVTPTSGAVSLDGVYAYNSQDNDEDDDGLDDAWELAIVNADPNDTIATIEDVQPDDDFDHDGTTNDQEFQAGTDPTIFDLALFEGWNLIALPRQLPGGIAQVTALFPDSLHQHGWVWDGSTYATAQNVTDGAALWIELGPAASGTTFEGNRLPTTPISLPAGWNLLAVPTRTSYPAHLDLTGSIWVWNAQSGVYTAVSTSGNDAVLLPGKAYWMQLDSAGTVQPGAVP